MEIVILDNMVATYAGNWVRIANAQGYDRIQIHDRFREQGFGEGAEEIEVEGVDFSPIGGASRLFVRRAANNTKAEIHKSGVVMLQTNVEREANVAAVMEVQAAGANPIPLHNLSVASGAGMTWGVNNTATASTTAMVEEPAKRGRGRPKGSPNKPKQPLVPTWPGV